MRPTRRAVIDVGTNSIKLLAGEVLDGRVVPIDERSERPFAQEPIPAFFERFCFIRT